MILPAVENPRGQSSASARLPLSHCNVLCLHFMQYTETSFCQYHPIPITPCIQRLT